MRITFDLPRLQQRPLGMQTYIENVLASIFNEAPAEWKFYVRAMGLRGSKTHRQRVSEFDENSRAERIYSPLPETIYESLLTKNLDVWRAGFNVDLIHSFGSRPVRKKKAALVVAIQDVIPIRLNEGDPDFIKHSRATLSQLALEANKLITISEFSKSEIAELLSVPPEKIQVIPDGVDLNRYQVIREEELPPAQECLRRLGVKTPYLLNIGGPSQRKNKARLLEAFEILKKRFDIPHSLVLVGESQLEEAVQDKLQQNAYKTQIQNLGYLTPQDALWVLQQADTLVFPSTYEGFGLPPLEAMACGVPVALSNSSSLPEVGGEAAIYFDPLNVEQMATAVHTILNNDGIKKNCIAQGLVRANSLTWTHNARRTIELYNKALA